MRIGWMIASLALAACATAPIAESADNLTPLEYRVGGRAHCVSSEGGGEACTRQWPGTYFEAAFAGERAFIRIGEGEVRLKISLDGVLYTDLVRPEPGLVEIKAGDDGAHIVRVDVVSESQAGPSTFGGFFAPAGVSAATLADRELQFEFVGDSGTVGYANESSVRECSDEEVWETTNTSLGFGALVSAQYGADYRVNAISGRGVVRNYGGGDGDTLPEAYPYVLFDHSSAVGEDADWSPELIVIGLGANDFSTALHDGEPWADRAALQADYVATYTAFLQQLRADNPDALMMVLSLDEPGGEKEAQADAAVDAYRAAGGGNLERVQLHQLAMDSCNWHPSIADNQVIAMRVMDAIAKASPDWAAR